MLLVLRKVAANWRSLDPFNLILVLLTLLDLINLFIITSFFLLLDNVFFPGFRRVKVKKPVFIIGHPRSGTTFVHHLFSQSNEIVEFKLWHLLFPALTLRFFMRPLLQLLISKTKAEIISEEAGRHMTLDMAEEEEILFFHNLDTQFLTLMPLGFLDDSYRDLRFHDLQPRHRRIKSARFLKSCFQRQIYYTGKTQIFAQMHFSTHRIKTLLEVFPDARFIYLDRTPYDTLPSFFSLIYYSLNKYKMFNKISTSHFRRYFEYRYQASKDLYQYFHDIWNNVEIDKDKVLIISYDMLRDDLMRLYKNIVEFTGIKTSEELDRAIKKQAKKQSQYKRKHTVKKLAEFGIDENRIKNDFSFYFQDGFKP
jgi:hypothetical protein